MTEAVSRLQPNQVESNWLPLIRQHKSSIEQSPSELLHCSSSPDCNGEETFTQGEQANGNCLKFNEFVETLTTIVTYKAFVFSKLQAFSQKRLTFSILFAEE